MIAGFWAQELRDLLQEGSDEAICVFLEELPPSETAGALADLSREEVASVLSRAAAHDPDLIADLLEHLDDAHTAILLQDLSAEEAAPIVDRMDSDEQADVLQEMPSGTAEAILEKMEPEEAADVRFRLGYDRFSAAGLMETEVMRCHAEDTVARMVNALRTEKDNLARTESRYLYLVDDDGRLQGFVRSRRLLLAEDNVVLSDLMQEEEEQNRVNLDADLDDLKALFDRVDVFTLPVVDAEGRFMGVVHRSSVQEGLRERATEDLMKFGGIIGGEELRDMPQALRGIKRLLFLLPNVLLSYLAVSVIAHYEPVIEKITVLAVFLPMVANLSGAAGNQAVAVSIRELSLGLIRPNQLLRVWSKEILVGGINGVAIGSLLACITYFMRPAEPTVALIVGGAYVLTCVFGVLAGGGLPLVLKRLGIDPAMMSSPLLTTLTDMASFFCVLSIASAALNTV